MALALRPGWFQGGARAADGSAWTLFGEKYPTNPRLLVTDAEWEMVRVWRWSQGGMAGPGHLPEGGGVCDNALLNLIALDLMNAAKAEFEDEHPPPKPAAPKPRRRR